MDATPGLIVIMKVVVYLIDFDNIERKASDTPLPVKAETRKQLYGKYIIDRHYCLFLMHEVLHSKLIILSTLF